MVQKPWYIHPPWGETMIQNNTRNCSYFHHSLYHTQTHQSSALGATGQRSIKSCKNFLDTQSWYRMLHHLIHGSVDLELDASQVQSAQKGGNYRMCFRLSYGSSSWRHFFPHTNWRCVCICARLCIACHISWKITLYAHDEINRILGKGWQIRSPNNIMVD